MLKALLFTICIIAITDAVPRYRERQSRYSQTIDSGLDRLEQNRGDIENNDVETIDSSLYAPGSGSYNGGKVYQGEREFQGTDNYQGGYQGVDKSQVGEEERLGGPQGGRGNKGHGDFSGPGYRGPNSNSDAAVDLDSVEDHGRKWYGRQQRNRGREGDRRGGYNYGSRQRCFYSNEDSDEYSDIVYSQRRRFRGKTRDSNCDQNGGATTEKTNHSDGSNNDDQKIDDGEQKDDKEHNHNTNEGNNRRRGSVNKKYRPRKPCDDCPYINNIGNGEREQRT